MANEQNLIPAAHSIKTEPMREDTSGMSHKLKVQYWPIDDVHPYPNNPRNNDDAVEYVANSIREFGWQQPIVVDTDGTIIAGHTRHKAAKLLGMDTVPVVVADNLTPAQVNAYRLADNKTSEAATWDIEALSVELEGLEIDFDMTEFGFDATEFSIATQEREDVEHSTLKERFGFVPFSVIRTTAADWMERKRVWLDMGIRSEEGRGGGLAFNCRMSLAASLV